MLASPEHAGITIRLTSSLDDHALLSGFAQSLMQVFTYNSSKANVGAMRPDKQTAAIKITSDLRNIVKERVVRKKNSVYEMKVV